jgi:uncharacterized protein YlxP (DUF503 family)
MGTQIYAGFGSAYRWRMTTYVCVLEIGLDLRHSQSLKEKRKVVSSLKAQLRQRFVAAVAETDHHDDRRRATLVVALVGGSEVGTRADELQRFVEARAPDGCRVDRDVLSLADLRA